MSFNAVTIEPPLPSLRRWLDLNKKFGRISTLRMMEYENITAEKFSGKVLDVGGGAKTTYQKHLPDDIDYISVNIDDEFDPTHIVEPENPLPVADGVIDHCISLNTLEHVYDPKFLTGEIHRVLKPGGKLHLTVPWMFKIHGHPEDYLRATPTWWIRTLKEDGYSDVRILPLVWGRRSTAGSVVGVKGILRKLRRHIYHLDDVLYSKILFRGKKTYSGKRGANICNIAVGHYIVATK